MKQKTLNIGDVPKHLREYLDFDSIKSDLVYNERRIQINKKCPKCLQISRIRIDRVREALKIDNPNFLCKVCYSHLNRTGEKSGTWRGGRYVNAKGYVEIRMRNNHPHANRNGIVLEHRLVMEQHLGRYLHPNEVVHHKNGIRHDNRIENLELWIKSHPKGQRPDERLPHCATCTCER